MMPASRVALAIGLSIMLAGCERDRAPAPEAAVEEYDYWASSPEECRERAITTSPDSTTMSDLVACARQKKFKKLKDGRWVGDEQLLMTCRDADDVTTCRPVTWAVAVPVDSLERLKDRDFAQGAIVVAHIRADRDYPASGDSAIIRGGGGWVNYVHVQLTDSTWSAFLIAKDTTTTGGGFYKPLTVHRKVHLNSAGRPIDPPGHVLWWFKPDVETLEPGESSSGADDGLWTRCGTGCCTISGFQLAMK